MAADEDAALMLAFQSGEPEAFSTLVERHQSAVVAYFFALGRDRGLAEDLAQELFVKIFRNRLAYEPKASFRTYMYSLARNVWIDAYRSRKRSAGERSLDAADVEAGELPASERYAADVEAPEEGALRNELARELSRAIAKLPSDMREVFVLGAVQEMDYASISKVMDIPVGTVKSRMFNAVRRLRELLSALASRLPPEKAPPP